MAFGRGVVSKSFRREVHGVLSNVNAGRRGYGLGSGSSISCDTDSSAKTVVDGLDDVEMRNHWVHEFEIKPLEVKY